MKKRKTAFIILTISYFLVTAADLTLTFLATPDLSLEGNPLVTTYKFGWTGLVAINVVTLILYFIMARYAFIKYRAPESDETEDIKRYLADITYGDPEKTSLGMWKWPKYWAPQIACLCYSVATALPFARVIVVIEWLLMLNHVRAPLFFTVVAMFPLGRIDFFAAVILAWVLSGVWIRKEFLKNAERKEKEEMNK